MKTMVRQVRHDVTHIIPSIDALNSDSENPPKGPQEVSGDTTILRRAYRFVDELFSPGSIVTAARYPASRTKVITFSSKSSRVPFG